MPDDRSFQLLEVRPERLEASPASPRRRWSAEAKGRLVAEAMQSVANVSAIARRNGMSPAQLFGWRRQALKRMAELGETSATAAAPIIEIMVGGRHDPCRRRYRRRATEAGDPGGAVGMIPAGVKVLVASHPVDFRNHVERRIMRSPDRLRRVYFR